MPQPVIFIDYDKHVVRYVGGDPTKDKAFAEFLRSQAALTAATQQNPKPASK